VESAALYAGPLLHGVAFVLLTAFVAWQFGALPAALFGVGLVTFFPLAARFLPGVPDPLELARVCGVAGLLVFLAGLHHAERRPRWFALAGVLGGLGAWFDVSMQLVLVAGLASGGLLALGLGRAAPEKNPGGIAPRAWRIWSVTGAVTVLAAYLLEYYPDHLGEWHWEAIHPVDALVWLAVGELLAWTTTWRNARNGAGKIPTGVALLLAAACAAGPVILSWSGSRVVLARNLAALRLTDQPDGIVAANLWRWLARDGASAAVWTTLFPAAAAVAAVWFLWSSGRARNLSGLIPLALMPVVVLLGIAAGQLNAWSLLDGAVLVLIVAATAGISPAAAGPARWFWPAFVAVAAATGIVQLLPRERVNADMKLTTAEAQELIERDLAHWLAAHADEPRAIVFAPPRETATLCFYGGLRGIGTFATENSTGFGASLMIAGTQTMEEVEAQVRARGIGYIVIPSWDPFFEEFGRLYLNQAYSNRKSLLVGELRRWNLPPWLTPVAYPMPAISGFEHESVLVFAVVDPQNPAVAAGRLAEYLLETGTADQAAATVATLRRYPGDVGALAALAQVQRALGDAAGLAQTAHLLASRVADGADRFLAWDRRVSLAVVLAQDNQLEAARAQVRRCLAELNERRLRSLSPGALYRLLVLGHEFGLTFDDPRLRALALDLLPAELRANL
jgi:hypothetical protein